MSKEKNADALHDIIDAKLESIRTRDDLAEFVAILAQAVTVDAFEYQDLSSYLSGLRGVILGLNGLEKNTGIPNPDPPDWRLVGRILLYAFYHS
jgi:hypothetical protein